MPPLIKKLIKIIWHDDFDNLEVINTFLVFVWGIWFIFRPNLFDGVGVVYTILRSSGSEVMWGLLFVLIGLFKLLGIALDRYRVRKFVAWWVMVFWCFLCISFYSQNSSATLCLVAGYQSIFACWEYFRHARKADTRKEAREILGIPHPEVNL